MKSQPYFLAYLAASRIEQKSFSLSEIVRPALVFYESFVAKVNQAFNFLTLLVLVVLFLPFVFNVSLDLALNITISLQFVVQMSRLFFQSKLVKSFVLTHLTQKVYQSI